MDAVFSIIIFVILPAILSIVVCNIIHGLFQTPEVPPATGATRSRTIQH